MRNYLMIAPVLLAGCGQVPVASMVELSKFDPLASDLSVIRVAVDVTDGLRVQPDSAVMVLGATSPNGRNVQERFVLTQTGHDTTDATRWLFGIASQDEARLAETQSAISVLKQENDDTKGQLSVTAAPCTTGATDTGTIDVFLQLAPDRPFVPVAPQVDLAAEGVPVPPCTPAG